MFTKVIMLSGAFAVLGSQFAGAASHVTADQGRHATKLEASVTIAHDDAWIVGAEGDMRMSEMHPVTLHFDGRHWGTVPTPHILGRLTAIAALSSDDVWAVGNTASYGGDRDTLAMHWNGASWQRVHTPSGFGQFNYLTSVTALGSHRVLAVGFYNSSGEGPDTTLALLGNGSHWKDVSDSLSGTSDVAAVSDNDAWAVGQDRREQTLIRHWDGRLWSRVPSPDATSRDGLRFVSASSRDDIWAAGLITGTWTTFIEHWNGRRWSIVNDGLPAQVFNATGLSASPDHDVWLLGFIHDTPTVEHWTGSSWESVALPASKHPIRTLDGVAAGADDDAWIVGSWSTCTGAFCFPRRIVAHWNGTHWQLKHGH